MTEQRKQQIEQTIDTLKEVWLKYPDLRLCQLLENALSEMFESSYEHNKYCIFYVGDDKIRTKLKEYDQCIRTGQS